jgi:hypothetical protein
MELIRMKSMWKSLLVVMALMMGLAGTVQAAIVEPNPVAGNDNKLYPMLGSIKFEPKSGTITKDGITITVVVSPDGKSMSWTSSKPVLFVTVKGGPNYNFYNYLLKNATADTGLAAPLNGGGKVPGLSHMTFFFCQCN